MKRFTVRQGWDDQSFEVLDNANAEVLAVYPTKEAAQDHADAALISYRKEMEERFG